MAACYDERTFGIYGFPIGLCAWILLTLSNYMGIIAWISDVPSIHYLFISIINTGLSATSLILGIIAYDIIRRQM